MTQQMTPPLRIARWAFLTATISNGQITSVSVMSDEQPTVMRGEIAAKLISMQGQDFQDACFRIMDHMAADPERWRWVMSFGGMRSLHDQWSADRFSGSAAPAYAPPPKDLR